MTQLIRPATLLLACAVLFALPVLADHHEKPEAAPDMAMVMEAMNKAMAPGEHHDFLAGMVGEWTYTSTMWMDPSQPPMKTSGKATKSMILGGRYLQDSASGEMMGMAFHGRGVTGYDNVQKQFVSTWIDNMGTGVMVSHGQRDGNTLTLEGEMADPMSGQMMNVRMVTRVVDADRHLLEMYMVLPDAPDLKSMEIEYVRKSE